MGHVSRPKGPSKPGDNFPVSFERGVIVVDNNDRDSNGEPTGKKLWVWENKYDPPSQNSRGAMLYLLKDGPGEDAKDVRWTSEKYLREWYPTKEEESLIDL